MSDPQWQQGNQPYQPYGQDPVQPPGQGYPPPPGQPGGAGFPPAGPPPAAGGWPGQAPGQQGFPPPPPGAQQPYGQPPQPGYPPQGMPPQGPGQPGWPGAPGFPPQGPKPKRTGLIVGSVIGAVVLVAAIVLGAVIFWPDGDDGTPGGGGEGAPIAATEDHGIVVGSGSVKVDLWIDFQCPACKAFHEANGDKIEQMSSTNRIKVVYHPLNFLDQMSTDEYSTRAGSAAVCAADEGKFEAYADFLFENQPAEGGPGLTEDELVQGGTALGLSNTFVTCVHDVKYRAWLDEGTAAMTVSGTPAASINGTEVTDMSTFAEQLAAATG